MRRTAMQARWLFLFGFALALFTAFGCSNGGSVIVNQPALACADGGAAAANAVVMNCGGATTARQSESMSRWVVRLPGARHYAG